MTDAQREVFFLEIHRAIEAAAVDAALLLTGSAGAKELAYPPNGGLTAEELDALAVPPATPARLAAVRKIVAAAAAAPIFELFALLDGVADPAGSDATWPVFSITEASDLDDPGAMGAMMLHDQLGDSYWNWRAQRPNPGWRLDNHPGP